MALDLGPATPTGGTRSLWERFAGYGWMTILVGAVAMAATYPGRTHGLGMITEPLLEDLHLADADGRVLYASLNFWATMIGALFCLPVGWLFDRCDRRAILAGNLVLLGLSVGWMSRVEAWPQLFVGLILTRGFGQSALSVVSITLVAKRFDARQLGLAMAWYAILAAPCHLLLIQGVGWALTDRGLGWRDVWAGVGASLVALSLTSLLLDRGRTATSPTESLFQKGTGSKPNQASSSKNGDMARCLSPFGTDSEADGPPLAGSTFRQALATPAFWVFALTISLWGMIYAGVALFNVDIFRERGFDEKLYFNVLALVTVVALAAKLFFGWLVNLVRLNRLLAACLLVTAASLGGLPWATRPWHAYLYAVGLGVASGAVALLFFAAWGKLYGRRELGRIQAVAQMLTVFASACGPLVFSYGKRAMHSYGFTFHLLAACVLLMALAAWTTPLPRSADG